MTPESQGFHLVQLKLDDDTFDKLKKDSVKECRSMVGTALFALRLYFKEKYGDDSSDNR